MKLFSTPPLSQFQTPSPRKAQAMATAPQTTEPQLPNLTKPRVTAFNRLAKAGRWRVEAMRALSEPCLLWFTRGQGRVTLGGVTRGYGPNNLIFIPPGVMHSYELGSQPQGQVVFFGRDTEIELPHAAHHLRVRDAVAQGEIGSILEAVSREIDSDRPAADRALHHQLGLVSVWLERQIASNETAAIKPSAARRLVSRYSALVERDFRAHTGVAELAGELGVTVTHLTRACRESCGKGASEMLQERRLYEARELLRDTRIPVKDIAARLGYTSPAYFTRAFHAKTGKTPVDFRRNG
ncbi:AraC family transcriptional regulator [Thioclava dalianensis]|uniref:AraC family transcriptional regulator n=1 Tax=Thioclava dalianensis TaxID=1185766 RepID=A0A074U5Y6_9RHOB|nr:AraC family transcriptional regulator [Thioclava dalianensis]KEP70062.1 AraC family transcriptional regulator [Thioclava dalianensis]SFN52260.1 AraC-type DNA-binding protein [Thioclava dalianensis]